MSADQPNDDAIGNILRRHGVSPIAGLMDDLADTYRRIGAMLGVYSAAQAITRRAAFADVHAELGALAMTAHDQISAREHSLTATRLSAADDLAAMIEKDAQLAVPPPADDTIYAVYDLSKGPITYDFPQFLMLAEDFRKRARRSFLYVIFVPAPGDGFRHQTERDRFLSRDRKLWRLLNLLAPCAALLPSCVGTTVCQTREEAATLLNGLRQDCIFPSFFSLAAPTCPYLMPMVLERAAQGGDIRAFRAPAVAAEMVKRWFAEIAGTKPVVSITLRQSDFQKPRNSNQAAWRAFATFCVEQGFHPVFIPDTEALLAGEPTGFEDFSVLHLPALSVGYRMAVYQESFVNTMVSNGPYSLCAYHPTARYLMFKVLNPAVKTCTAGFLTAQGMPPGRQLAFAGPQQRFVWEPDDAQVIINHFTDMVHAVLAESDPGAEAPAPKHAADIAEPADPVDEILIAHDAPKIAALAEDLVTTALHVAQSHGVHAMTQAGTRRSAHAGLHATLAALAAAAGDGLSTREHARAAALLGQGAKIDMAAVTQIDAEFDVMPGPNCAYAVFDLSQAPAGFDFLHFLMLAERFRQSRNKLGLHVLFVPGGASAEAWALHHLLSPCAQLVPNCVGVKICASRAEAATILAGLPANSIFPQGYSVTAPGRLYGLPAVLQEAATGPDIRALRAPALAAALVQRWFAEIAGDKPVVSITLRQRDDQPARNSNLAAWRDFAGYCAGQGFQPVFIPDTAAVLNGTAPPVDGFPILTLPALSIGYRMAAYQQSFANLMVHDGPAALCAYHPTTRFLLFKMPQDALAVPGLLPGTQFAFAGPHQTIVWEDDTADVLIRSFTAMVDNVLAERGAATAPRAAAG